MEFPLIGIGTYKLRTQESINIALDNAIKNGYKLIDTAEHYKNQKLIGNYFLNNPDVRKNIWITSKVSFVSMKKGEDEIIKGIEKTFEDLNTDYIDLYILHAPIEENYIFAWNHIRSLQKMGKIRHVGVSNFTVSKLVKFMELIGPEESKYIFCNQIEFNPFLNRKEIINFCIENNICVTAYGSLYKSNEMIVNIANKLNKTPQQVLLKWAIQQNIRVIPMSQNPDHIKDNFNLDFEIPKDMIDNMSELNENYSHYPKYL